jgi:hypothetical protein
LLFPLGQVDDIAELLKTAMDATNAKSAACGWSGVTEQPATAMVRAK